MKVHELKTWPDPFEALLMGLKNFEIRKNDRGFKVGDILILKEWEPNHTTPSGAVSEAGEYTGRGVRAGVTYMAEGSWDLPPGLCVMSIRIIDFTIEDDSG